MSLSSSPRRILPILGMSALACLALTCTWKKEEVPAECLAVPEASQVEMVKVDVRNPDGTLKDYYQIDTRPRVEALLAELRKHPGGDCRTVEKTDRPQEMTVAFNGYSSVPLILWIGPDWIGGVDEKKGPNGWRISRWRPLGSAERASLLHLLRREERGTAPEPGSPHEPPGRARGRLRASLLASSSWLDGTLAGELTGLASVGQEIAGAYLGALPGEGTVSGMVYLDQFEAWRGVP